MTDRRKSAVRVNAQRRWQSITLASWHGWRHESLYSARRIIATDGKYDEGLPGLVLAKESPSSHVSGDSTGERMSRDAELLTPTSPSLPDDRENNFWYHRGSS